LEDRSSGNRVCVLNGGICDKDSGLNFIDSVELMDVSRMGGYDLSAKVSLMECNYLPFREKGVPKYRCRVVEPMIEADSNRNRA
jgi:hypothetical protein